VSKKTYDAVFALAVFEHFTEEDLIKASLVISQMLSDDGELIVTVPSPYVDTILYILRFFSLVEAETLDEHHGPDKQTLINIMTKHLILISSSSF